MTDVNMAGAQDAISVSTPDQQGQPGLGVSAKLNLARLLSTWRPQRAVELYSELISEDHSSSNPKALLAQAHALAECGQAHEAAKILHSAADDASTPEVHAHTSPCLWSWYHRPLQALHFLGSTLKAICSKREPASLLTAFVVLQAQVECLHALLRCCIALGDTGGFFTLLDSHQELLLSAPAPGLLELWLTAQAAAVLPAFRGFEAELAGRFATWQVIPQNLPMRLVCQA